MNMKAIAQNDAVKQALVESLAAGCDLLLICRHLDRCYMALEAIRQEASRAKPSLKVERSSHQVNSFRQQFR